MNGVRRKIYFLPEGKKSTEGWREEESELWPSRGKEVRLSDGLS